MTIMENKELITKAIEYIQKNPKENLSLESIALEAGFTLTYFDLLFRNHTGYSPVQYSRVYKLTRSALVLRRFPEKSILDIALDFGYQSPESYSRAFKSFYGISPSEYREKYTKEAVTWDDLSSKIAIERFVKTFPELKPVGEDAAFDYLFTHNPVKHAEDIVFLGVSDCALFTLGDPEDLEGYICVADYNSAEPSVEIVCDDEDEALKYLETLCGGGQYKFTIRVDPGAEWERFNSAAAKERITCRTYFDMIYPYDSAEEPTLPDGYDIRKLTPADMPAVKCFKDMGGCGDVHVGAIRIAFDGTGNVGLSPFGLFRGNTLIALSMLTLDKVRDFRKYDIGALFALDGDVTDDLIYLMWRYAAYLAAKDRALLGNASAEEDDSPYSVLVCQKAGLVTAAEERRYGK